MPTDRTCRRVIAGVIVGISLAAVMLPIPGASRITSAVDSAAAMRLVLTPADHADLDRAFPTAP
jgi:aryl-alcohol dehydrogenase-like predicted oxidoreductase